MSLHDLYQHANDTLVTAITAAWHYPLPWGWILAGAATIAVIAALLERIFRPMP